MKDLDAKIRKDSKVDLEGNIVPANTHWVMTQKIYANNTSTNYALEA